MKLPTNYIEVFIENHNDSICTSLIIIPGYRGQNLKSIAINSGFSSIPRTNLSPFTKDFRGEEHYNESID